MRRLRRKWLNLLQKMSPTRDLECLTFGRVFSQDPIDCGSPRCPICSFEKILHSKRDRILRRKEERKAQKELEEI